MADLELISGEPMVGMAKPFHESEMALFSECMEQCAKKVLDNAGIVRDAIFHQP